MKKIKKKQEPEIEYDGKGRRRVIRSFDFKTLSYDNPFKDLMSIVNWHDTEELIAMGLPETEYTGECRNIFVRLFDVETEKEMHNMIYKVFLFAFGRTARRKSRYKQLAIDILTWRNGNSEQIEVLYKKERRNSTEYLEKTLEAMETNEIGFEKKK